MVTKSTGVGRGRYPRPQKTDEEREGYIIQKRANNLRWSKQYQLHNPAKKLLWASRRRAKAKGLEHTILEEDIKIPTHCPYLGIELIPTNPIGTKRDQIISLDRIDSSKGYTPNNIEVISWLANTMKNSATAEQLEKFAREVIRRVDDNLFGR